MTPANDLPRTCQKAQEAYQNGDYLVAAQFYQLASNLYTEANDRINAAEMENNKSVALLKSGDANGALKACQGTEKIFAEVGDTRRQAIAFGNQAAAVEALGNTREALDLYIRSSDLLKASGDQELRAYVLSSVSRLQMKMGRRFEAMASMSSALEVKKKLTLKERFLKALLKIPFRMMGSS
jgi:tetratricopeptide (TPR) repeat protein